MTVAEMEELALGRARTGAALLDAELPEWWRRIDTQTLAMMDPESCILGQLYGWLGYTKGLGMLGLATFGDEVINHGFCPGDERHSTAFLRGAWVAIVEARRATYAGWPEVDNNASI